MMKKVCNKCLIDKPITHFNRCTRKCCGYRNECRECQKNYFKIYRIKNITKEITRNKQYHQNNSERLKSVRQAWTKANNKRCAEKVARRRSNIKKQKLSIILKEKNINVYTACPKGLTVDHIIPIKGKGISGLHVPWNLQYLTKSDNSKKKNKFDGTYENESWRK